MTDTLPKYTRRSPEQWQAFIDQWQQSGLSVPAFCEQHGLGNASFYKWRQRLASVDDAGKTIPATSDPDFIDISALGSSENHSTWTVVLNLGDGLSLTLNRH
tara:strand:+ start:863 stop:1168 length:306 start_codon:yes stop_codon:yes gene_type:complete